MKGAELMSIKKAFAVLTALSLLLISFASVCVYAEPDAADKNHGTNNANIAMPTDELVEKWNKRFSESEDGKKLAVNIHARFFSNEAPGDIEYEFALNPAYAEKYKTFEINLGKYGYFTDENNSFTLADTYRTVVNATVTLDSMYKQSLAINLGYYWQTYEEGIQYYDPTVSLERKDASDKDAPIITEQWKNPETGKWQDSEYIAPEKMSCGNKA